MKFGPIPVSRASGTILAHSVKVGDRKLRKGVRLTPEHIAQMDRAGLTNVTVARMEPGDCHEDEAARTLATALAPDPSLANLRLTEAFTGRVNLVAESPGVAVLSTDALHRFNQVNAMITVATVPQYQQMNAGGMVATLKIISSAVPKADVIYAANLAHGAIRVAKPVLHTAGLVVTDIPGGPPNEKGIAAIPSGIAGEVKRHSKFAGVVLAIVDHVVGNCSLSSSDSPGSMSSSSSDSKKTSLLLYVASSER